MQTIKLLSSAKIKKKVSTSQVQRNAIQQNNFFVFFFYQRPTLSLAKAFLELIIDFWISFCLRTMVTLTISNLTSSIPNAVIPERFFYCDFAVTWS